MATAHPQEDWTVQAALDWTVSYLESKNDEHPRRSAEWLMSAATGLSRIQIYTFFDRFLSGDERSLLREGVRRRALGEPLQYVTGEVAFRHIVVHIERGVLIPRPETEILVDVGLAAVDEAIEARGEARILDLCCGSGVIALSIANERPLATVFATDIDPKAVALTMRNAQALYLQDRVEVFECDLASALGEDLLGTFDLVISNPPYIPTAELSTLPLEVSGFEPRIALDGGVDGLEVFNRICGLALGYLRSGGMLACELHENTLAQAASYCVQWYQQVEVVRDLTNRDRILRARHP